MEIQKCFKIHTDYWLLQTVDIKKNIVNRPTKAPTGYLKEIKTSLKWVHNYSRYYSFTS